MRRLRPLRPLLARPRLLIAIAVGLTAALTLPGSLSAASRSIIALDAGGAVFLALAWSMMARATPETMRRRARQQDAGRLAMLLLTIGAALFSLIAIALELHDVKTLARAALVAHLGLAAFSLVCSWLVTHTLFALHYAHDFYGDAAGGLAFPASDHPEYWDFLYFAFVVGMTCQTSDVAVTSSPMRRLCLAQGVLAFFFNTVILALSINIAASLI